MCVKVMAANWFSQSQNPHIYWLWRQQQQIHNIHNKWIIDNKTEARMFEFKCIGQLFIHFLLLFSIHRSLFINVKITTAEKKCCIFKLDNKKCTRYKLKKTNKKTIKPDI